MKELRITAVVPMPDDAMEAGEKMAALKPHVETFAEALGVKVVTSLVRPVERKAKAVEAAAAPKIALAG